MTAAGFKATMTDRGLKFERLTRVATGIGADLAARIRNMADSVLAVQAGDIDAVPAVCRCDTTCFRCGGLVTWQAFVDGIPDRVCGGSEDGQPCPFRHGHKGDPGAGDGG